MSIAWVRCWFQTHAARPAWRRLARLPALALLLAAALLAPAARADGIELTGFELERGDEGLLLGYQAQVELPRAVEDALQKGVPLYFVAEAAVYRPRWYWRDERVARASRHWRLTWQPLTRHYRVNFGSLSQNYESLSGALGAIQRGSRWRLAAPGTLEADEDYYLDFGLRLDISQLPRPLQIGFGGDADWNLAVERTVVVPRPLPP